MIGDYMKKDLNIDLQIQSDFLTIEQDIKDINDIINRINQTMLKLDDNFWHAKEKEKLDAEFMPYLKKYSDKYEIYLMKRLNFIKDAVLRYEELDRERSKLEDIEVL